jgi:hypothetical protein
VHVNTEGDDKTITFIGSVAYMCASLLMKIFKVLLLLYYQAMAEDPRPTPWSKGSPGIVGNSRVFWVGNLTRHYGHSLKPFQFHWSFWAISLPGTSIGI